MMARGFGDPDGTRSEQPGLDVTDRPVDMTEGVSPDAPKQ